MKILILGGNGFIGKNLSKKLKDKNEIIIVDLYIDYNFFEDLRIPKTNLFQLDLLNIKNYSNIFYDIDIIFYLVNFTTPFLNTEETKKAYFYDISVCLDILELSRKYNIQKIIFPSSGGTVYGDLENNLEINLENNLNNSKIKIDNNFKNNLKSKINDNFVNDLKNETKTKYSFKNDLKNEEDITNPINNYGISKLTIEKILLMYNRLYGMNNVILRISNLYGTYQVSNNIGIISIFLRKILNNEDLEIFGNGTNIRDYIYIDDFIEICTKIMYKQNCNYNIYNIGSGEGTSILDIINLLKKITKKDFNIKLLNKRDFDIKKNVLDISRIKKEFDFTPKISLEEGINKLYLYLKKYGQSSQ